MSGYSAFAVCLPGLAPLLETELRNLGLNPGPAEPGGVPFETDLAGLYRANLHSGVAGHVLLRVSTFGARSLADLDKRGARIDWRAWLPTGTPFQVKATCRRSRIYHSGAAEARIEKHLVDQLEPADNESAAVIVRVRIDDNRCQISLDTSGEPLHRRGWRQQTAKAPLREDLAHALLLASEWDQESPLLDPMCGSGTILIEAAALARGLAPGRARGFAIERFALHQPPVLDAIRAAATDRASAELPFRIHGSDRDAGAVAATLANAERAGVAGDVQARACSVSACLEELEPAAIGALVCNPPYGQRVGQKSSLGTLYQTLGRIAKSLPNARVALAGSDRKLVLRTGLALKTAFLTDHGGLKIRGLTS